jgi:hypothetical protein
LSHHANEDYRPAKPLDWDEPAEKAGEGRALGTNGNPVRRQARRRSIVPILLVLVIALVVLAGGLYGAQVEGWLDLSSILSGDGLGTRPGAETGHLIFSGKATELASPTGNLVQQDRSDGSVTWIRSSIKQAGPAGSTDGASIEIKQPLATNLAGKRIRVTISARAPDSGSPVPFAAAYSSANVGTSGWIVFTPTKEFDDYAFEYQVPATVGTAQYVGVWSDISGRGAPLAVRTISIRTLN